MSTVLAADIEEASLQSFPEYGGSEMCILHLDARIGRSAWVRTLEALYAGELRTDLSEQLRCESDDLTVYLEQIRACLIYRLPDPLLAELQRAFFKRLPKATVRQALRAFS
eukprot:2165078-Amphidinium_carterae.1